MISIQFDSIMKRIPATLLHNHEGGGGEWEYVAHTFRVIELAFFSPKHATRKNGNEQKASANEVLFGIFFSIFRLNWIGLIYVRSIAKSNRLRLKLNYFNKWAS